MKKDDFKYSIIKQFRAEESPIHALMLGDYPRISALTVEDSFVEEKTFFATEYGLTFTVERVEDDEGIAKFQVRFKDLERDFVLLNNLEKYDVSSPEFEKHTYCVECMEVDEQCLNFILIKFSLQNVSSQVRYGKYTSTCIASLDMKKMELEVNTLDAQSLWEDTRNVTYVQYLYNTEQKMMLSKALNDNQVDAENRIDINTAFLMATATGRISSMSKVLESLRLSNQVTVTG